MDNTEMTFDNMNQCPLCDRRAAPSSSADELPPHDIHADPDDNAEFCNWREESGVDLGDKWVAWSAWCGAMNFRAAIQAAAPADAPMQTFEEWWSTPSKVSGHAPSDVMDGYSARSAWVAARRAPAEDAREQQLAGVKEEGKEG